MNSCHIIIWANAQYISKRRNEIIITTNGFDFHIHSVFSDGTNDILELAKLCERAKLKCTSLTDHNCIDGTLMMQEEACRLGIGYLTGVEASCKDRIHMLGLGFDPEYPAMVKFCDRTKRLQKERSVKQINILEKLGFQVNRAVLEIKNGAITETDIFRAVKNSEETFEEFTSRWLSKESRYYVKIVRPSVKEIIDLIHSAGGIAIWAHPGHTFRNYPKKIQRVMTEFQEYGLDGIEVFSSKHDQRHTMILHRLALKFGFIESAGSDFHGYRSRTLGGYNTFGIEFDGNQLIKRIKNKAK